MSHWNYRVVRTVVEGEENYAIHEVYYDPLGPSANPVTVEGDSVDDLRWQLERMMKALDKPVIEDE